MSTHELLSPMGTPSPPITIAGGKNLCKYRHPITKVTIDEYPINQKEEHYRRDFILYTNYLEEEWSELEKRGLPGWTWEMSKLEHKF